MKFTRGKTTSKSKYDRAFNQPICVHRCVCVMYGQNFDFKIRRDNGKIFI